MAPIVLLSLWLTLEGQPDDIWLKRGEKWIAKVPAILWLSGEPHASFERPHPAAPSRKDAAWARAVHAGLAASYRAIFLTDGRSTFI